MIKVFESSLVIPYSFEGCCCIEISKVHCWLSPGKQNHRIDGPAVVYDDGTKFWYENNVSHRLDGPSDEWTNGARGFFIHGKHYMEEDYWKHPLVLKHKINKILEL